MARMRKCFACGVVKPMDAYNGESRECGSCVVSGVVPAPVVHLSTAHPVPLVAPSAVSLDFHHSAPIPIASQLERRLFAPTPLHTTPLASPAHLRYMGQSLVQDLQDISARQVPYERTLVRAYRPVTAESVGRSLPMVAQRVELSTPMSGYATEVSTPLRTTSAQEYRPLVSAVLPAASPVLPQTYRAPPSPLVIRRRVQQDLPSMASTLMAPAVTVAYGAGASNSRVSQSARIASPQITSSVCKSVVDCIGHTPMVQLNRLTDGVKAKRVLVKLEMQNPGGSVKDRIAKSMIEDAELAGLITPGQTTVIEYTSGNTGIGLAMVCAAKGYRCIIVMPQVPAMKERYMTCRKFGAEVHLTAAARGIKGAEAYVNEQLAIHSDYWCPRQFQNPANPKVHLETTGPELWEQSGGDIDILVAGAGTGGTISALASYLKEKNPKVHIVLVEPTESRVLVGHQHSAHSIVGIGAGFPLPFIEALAPGQSWQEGPRGVIDEFQHCNGADAIVMAEAMAAQEGLLVGPSAGAAVKVALDVAKRPESLNKTVVVICASSAIRYVSHPLWASVRAEADAALPTPANPSDAPLLRWTSDAGDHTQG